MPHLPVSSFISSYIDNFSSQVWEKKKHLYYPAYKQLKGMSHTAKYRRKTKRADPEAPLPTETDINFLKELQFCRIEEQVQKHNEAVAKERLVRVDAAKTAGELEECVCCFSDEVGLLCLSCLLLPSAQLVLCLLFHSGAARGDGALQQRPQVLRDVRAAGVGGGDRRGQDRPLVPRAVRGQLRAGHPAARTQRAHVLQVAQKDPGKTP